jgi:tetratricopeptide (TPR) repeat protein
LRPRQLARRLLPTRLRQQFPHRWRRAARRAGDQAGLVRVHGAASIPRVHAAEQASRAKDWPAAAQRWRVAIDRGRRRARPASFARLSEAHRKQGQLDEAAVAVAAGLRWHPQDVGLLVEQAELATAAGDLDEAVVRWEYLAAGAAGTPPLRAFLAASEAHRAQGDVDRAAAVVEQGRLRYPDARSLIVADAQISLRRYREVDEDEAFAWKIRLVHLAAALEEREESGSRTELAALAEVALELRRWDVAARVWGRIAERHPQRADKVWLRQAEAYRQARDFPAAREALAKVDPAAVGAGKYATEVRRLGHRLGRWVTDEVSDYLKLVLSSGEPEQLGRLIEGALLLRGRSLETVADSRTLIEELAALAAGTDSPDRLEIRPSVEEPPGGTCPRKVVLVSGFLYSGSGAVFDHLRQYACVDLPFSVRETGLLKKPDHLGVLFASESRATEAFPRAVVRCVLASVFGLGQTGRSLLEFFPGPEPSTAQLLWSTRRLVADARGACEQAADGGLAVVPREAVESCLRRFCDDVIAMLSAPGRMAVLNNAILGHELDLMTVFSDAKAVGVFRDPRDQYVSQLYESPNAMPCDAFIEMMEGRFDRFASLLADPRFVGRLRGVSFEDHVLDAAARKRFDDWLGIPGDEEKVRETFFPQKSARNIGVHRQHPDRGEIARVHDALAPWLAAVVQT